MDEQSFLTGFAPPPPDESQLYREVELYDKGRKLAHVYGTDAWNILLDSLKSYKDKLEEELWGMPIGDPNIPLVFAAASAIRQQFNFFQEDIKNAVDYAAKPNPEVAQYLYQVLDNSDVVKRMGV